MSIVAMNYVLLAGAMIAPAIALGAPNAPDTIVRVVCFLSAASVVTVAAVLSRATAEGYGARAREHFRLQKLALLLLVIGGISSAFRTFSYYEQFQIKFGFDILLFAISASAAAASLGVVVYGIFSSGIQFLRYPLKKGGPTPNLSHRSREFT